MIAVGAAAAYLYLGTPSGGTNCDPQVLIQMGASGSGLCLSPLEIKVSGTNSSEFFVPVLTMRPGTTGTIEILYDMGAGNYVSRAWEKVNLTSTEVPLAFSMALARPSADVRFSSGRVVFQNNAWLLYSYKVTALANATGYYSILPWYYVGLYPAFRVGSSSGSQNMSILANWGYTGDSTSGEVILPSMVVGTSGMTVANVTVSTTANCPSSACVLIADSLY